jgi:signal transduction histidine kinase
VFQLVHERTRELVENPIDMVLASGTVQTTIEPSILVLENGREHHVSAAAAPIRKPQGDISGVVMLLHDLSQEREIDRMKRNFVSSVSHELRTPLTSIKAYTETILRDPKMTDEKKREFLISIDEESNRLADLVNGLLEISQLESGSVEVLKQYVDIKIVIEQTVSSLRRSAEEKNIRIHVNVCSDIPNLWGNESKVRSMISNLINNAIKFTPRDGYVQVDVQHQHDELIICVSDTGMGIPKEEIPKIFDRFYRVHQPGKQIPGTGLGLAIVHEVAVLHGGKVEVESELGLGTTFKIFLPLADRIEFENSDVKVSNVNRGNLSCNRVV